METYIPRFFQPPNRSYFLFGPRGTGKSTFLRQHYPEALWIDLLKPDTFRSFSAKPERLLDLVHGNPDKKIIVVDEVQKVPEMLSAVHSLIEEKKRKTFILTGSSARRLKRSGVNLLAGRAVLQTFHPFLLAELKPSFSFERALQYGLLPIVVGAEDPKEVLEAYVALYVREEVQMEGLVRNLGGFSRFLEAISFSHAGLLNVSSVARECEVERKVVEGYIKILEDILLGFKLPVFSKKAKRSLVSHEKFFFFDSGVFRALRPKGPLDRTEEIAGAALEGFVLQHLRAWNAYRGNPYELFYWRSRHGVEVDFVLYGEQGLYAIEVKNAKRVREEDLTSLASFQQDYPRSKTFLLYRGQEKLVRKNILCMPCEEFLRQLAPKNDLSAVK